MGSTRATLTSVESTGPEPVESVVMSLVSPTAAMGYYAETEYLTTFAELPEGLLGYLSDVLRFEAFDPMKAYVPVEATIDMYIGAVARPDLLRVVMIPYGKDPVLVESTYSPDTMLVHFHATTSATDFFITSTVDACAMDTECDAKATCTNEPKGVYQIIEATCTC